MLICQMDGNGGMQSGQGRGVVRVRRQEAKWNGAWHVCDVKRRASQ